MTTQADRFLQVQYATLAIPGIHYNAGGMRCHPDQAPHEEDCSGLQSYAALLVGLHLPQPCMTAATLAAWCRASGTSISRSTAAADAGSWCFLGPPGGEHHVAVSTGDGRVFAARGHFVTPQIGFSPFDVDPWGSYGWPPGLVRTPLSDPLPGPTSPGEAAAMGFICGAVVPGSHPQAHPHAWLAHSPFVAVKRTADGHWHMVGLNGAALLNHDFQGHPAKNAYGVSDVDLGPLNGAIFDKDTPKDGPMADHIVFLADDGGTFVPEIRVDYPTVG